MKNIWKPIIISLIFALVLFISAPAQTDPPGMPNNHGENGDAPPGGGAPIGSGVILMVAMAAAYSSRKFCNPRTIIRE